MVESQRGHRHRAWWSSTQEHRNDTDGCGALVPTCATRRLVVSPAQLGGTRREAHLPSDHSIIEAEPARKHSTQQCPLMIRRLSGMNRSTFSGESTRPV